MASSYLIRSTPYLTEHKAAQDRERQCAADLWVDEGWMFTQPNALLVEAGVRDARLHDARHTAATVLLLLEFPERALIGVHDIRMLHFASFDLGHLPAKSAIIELKAEKWAMEDMLRRGDSGLRVALFGDIDRIAGAPNHRTLWRRIL